MVKRKKSAHNQKFSDCCIKRAWNNPCEPDWIRSIVEQCQAAGCPVFVKQFPLARHRKGNPAPHKVSTDPAEWPELANVRQFPQPHPGEET